MITTLSSAIGRLLLMAAVAAAGTTVASAQQPRDLFEQFATIALGREHETDNAGYVIKWTRPIRIGLLGERREAFAPQLRLHVAHLRTITGHDMEVVRSGSVEVAVVLVPRLDVPSIRRHADLYKRMFRNEAEFEAQLQRLESGALKPICLTTLRTVARTGEIIGAVAFIPLDRGERIVYQCIIEETAQLLGLPNDSNDVNPSIFNDNSPYVDLTDQDVLFLRILYDPRVKPGMRREELSAVFPAALAEARRTLNRAP